MKKYLALLLASLMLLATLTGCGLFGKETPEDSSTDTEAEIDTRISLITAGEATDYVIVYPDDASLGLTDIADYLAFELNNKYSDIEIQTKPAMAQWGESFFGEYEILIGNTGRPESDEALALVGDEQFVIKLFENGKLVINAKSDSQLVEAVNYFLITYVNNSEGVALLIEPDLEFLSVVSLDKRVGWLLSIPPYWGGDLSTAAYNTGYGFSFAYSGEGGRMQTIANTKAEEYNTYLAQLRQNGFSEVSSNTIGANKYAQYSNGVKLIYAYYIDALKESRVIYDTASDREDVFEYTYTAKPTDTTTFYQYSMMYDPTGQGGYNPPTKPYENNGLFDVIKLADNSVILIDGGWTPQAADAAVTELLSFLREITGTSEGQKVRIAAVFFTHGHGDHLHFVKRLLEMYSSEVTVERLMHNFPNINGWSTEDFASLGQSLIKNNNDIKFAKLHTGQKIQLADATFEVIYTHEDMADMDGKTKIIDYNNVSTMLKMTIKGKTFMLTGDWGGGHVNRDKYEYKPMEANLLAAYTLSDGSSYLKCDVVQIAHHAINDWMENFYKAVDADIAFFPQQDVTYNKLAHVCYKEIVQQLERTGMSREDMHFSGRYTYGLTVNNDGTMSLTYRNIAGADAAYLTAIGKLTPFHEPKNKTY